MVSENQLKAWRLAQLAPLEITILQTALANGGKVSVRHLVKELAGLDSVSFTKRYYNQHIQHLTSQKILLPVKIGPTSNPFSKRRSQILKINPGLKDALQTHIASFKNFADILERCNHG